MTNTTHIPAEARDSAGRFKKGAPGRKVGSKNVASRTALNAVHDMSSLAIIRLKEQVNESNMRAIELVLNYTLPRGGRTIDLDGSMNPNDVIEAATSGTISPDEFARISQGWKSAAEVSDMADIKAQIAELETIVLALRERK